MAVASKTLKITHLDWASEDYSGPDSLAELGVSGAEAWARFPAPDRFGTGRLGCWHNFGGRVLFGEGSPKFAAFKSRHLLFDLLGW